MNLVTIFRSISQIYMNKIIPILDQLSALPLLGMRLWIALIFWKSGLSKLDYWEGTVTLFQDEYMVPFLPPEFAAQLSTAVELSAPVLLFLGLGTRFAACALLGMTLVIEFTYMSFPIHQVWALILLMLITKGAGKISLDYLILCLKDSLIFFKKK